MKRKILNIEIDNISKDSFIKSITSGFFITVNVDMLVKFQKDYEFYKIYKKADWIICDSKIIGLALRLLGTPLIDVIPGSSFFRDYYEYHRDNENIRIFLLGSAEGVAEKARYRINEKIGRDIIVGAHSPSYGFEKNENECDQIIRIVNETSATVLVVGVGAPKQEKWIIKYKDRFENIKLFMPLGATIDFESGEKKRAPLIWQKMAIEWLYRALMDPKRLMKRYFFDDIPFFWLYIKQILGIYKNPFRDIK